MIIANAEKFAILRTVLTTIIEGKTKKIILVLIVLWKNVWIVIVPIIVKHVESTWLIKIQ